jgi:hypothetical protein
MMSGRDEETQPNATTRWRIVMACARYKLWTHIINNKKQTLRGLKKTIDNVW